MNTYGRLIVISAPSGGGKTTLVDRLKSEYPDSLVQSISYTTRSPRYNEKHGQDYMFVSKSVFDQYIRDNQFLEWADICGHYYGTLRADVKQLQVLGKHVLLVIDTQGAMTLKQHIQEGEAIYIFIAPPSADVLQERLLKRHTESEGDLKKRLLKAKDEMLQAKYYDHIVVNDNLEIAYKQLEQIIRRLSSES